MKRTLLALTLVALTGCAATPRPQTSESAANDAAAAPADADPWRVVDSTHCGFRVRMPASPIERVSTEDTESGPLTTWSLVAETRAGTGATVAACAQFDDGAELTASDAVFDSVQASIVKTLNGRVTAQHAVRIAGHRAREVRFSSPDGEGVLRILIAGRSSFTLMTLGVGPEQSTRFLESFALVGGARAPRAPGDNASPSTGKR